MTRFAGVPAILLVLVAACSGSSEGGPTSAAPGSTAAPATTIAITTTMGVPPTTATSVVPATTTTAPVVSHLWEEASVLAGDTSGTWSNKVELADIDGDGDVDVLVADGGDYTSAGTPAVNQAWVNDGAGSFVDGSVEVFGSDPDLSRAIKARDLNGDGLVDIIVGNGFQTQSRLYLGTGGGAFEEVTATHLPQIDLTVGDLEVGDVDGDSDLDLVLAHWGDGHPSLSGGGVTQLWLNDGTGRFVDATGSQMPDVPVEWSWELELVDIDNDFDLDVAVSCKECAGSFLFENDGAGRFSDVSERMPQYANNYEFEAMDLNGDSYLDLVTLNDGVNFGNHIFFSDGAGGFVDVTDANLMGGLGTDDNMVAYLDFDSDGDADVLVGNFGPRDRLLVNDGSGVFTVMTEILGGVPTGGPLATAVADLNGDGRLDVVQAQGEAGDMIERVYLGALVSPDTAPPIIGAPVSLGGVVHVRVHDNKSPLMPHDLASVVLRSAEGDVPMAWYGEYLWRAQPAGAGDHQVCAVDAAGNEACSDVFGVA